MEIPTTKSDFEASTGNSSENSQAQDILSITDLKIFVGGIPTDVTEGIIFFFIGVIIYVFLAI